MRLLERGLVVWLILLGPLCPLCSVAWWKVNYECLHILCLISDLLRMGERDLERGWLIWLWLW